MTQYSDQIELEIRRLLMESQSPENILDFFSSYIQNPQTPLADRRTVFSFALNCGLYKQIIKMLSLLLQAKQTLPWSLVMELFKLCDLKPHREVLESVLKGARRQALLDDLVLSLAWDEWDPRITQHRMDVQRQRQEQGQQKREQWLNKLHFYQHNHLLEEERKLLTLLNKMYPEDAEISALQLKFHERWARQIIAQHSQLDSSSESTTPAKLPQEELAHLKNITQAMNQIGQAQPDKIYDFAVNLMMMGYEEGALLLLKNQSSLQSPALWLKAEALLRHQHFIECLDHLTHLEQRLGGHPETIFAVTYLRAQALWGLKQTNHAIELLQTIVAVRPHYRSAMSLLKDWQKGISP